MNKWVYPKHGSDWKKALKWFQAVGGEVSNRGGEKLCKHEMVDYYVCFNAHSRKCASREFIHYCKLIYKKINP